VQRYRTETDPIESAAADFGTAVPRRCELIFLHGIWRCGGIYFWSKFRQIDGTTCYCEPFNEQLAEINSRKIRRSTADAWDSRHPVLDRPYFDEYRNVVTWRGLPRFDESFALARYFPAADLAGREIEYLSSLAGAALQRGTRPVFGCSRSLGRVEQLRQGLGGVHLVARRDPIQQWLSCRSFRVNTGSYYFEGCHFLILALAPRDSDAGRMARRLGIPRPPQTHVRRQLQWLRRRLGQWSDELSYRAFRAVHVLSYRRALRVADFVLDLDELTQFAERRATAQSALLKLTGLEIDLSDCRAPWQDPATVDVDFAAINRRVDRDLAVFALDNCSASAAAARTQNQAEMNSCRTLASSV
jgi:hypothetical protein